MDAYVRRTLVAASTAFLLGGVARAHCPSAPANDTPDCACYTGSGDWPLAAVGGDVVATAKKNRYARTSCWKHGGQPYWQIQRQIDSPVMAHFAAHLAGVFGGLVDLHREAWCTETVAFWHREAGVPYADGYGHGGLFFFWHPDSYVKSVRELSRWYAVEEVLRNVGFGGRGRWIDGQELDYADFQPGVNGPCPGAYQAWMTYDPGTGQWSTDCTHSQVVDSLVVHRIGGAGGPVVRVDVHVIEGNAGADDFVDLNGDTVGGGKVRNDRWYIDVIDYTKLGDTEIVCEDDKLWKIYGWGIDLHANGTTYCDDSRIGTVVTYLNASYPPPQGPNHSDDGAVAQIVAYATSTQGSVAVTSNSSLVQTGAAWPSPTTPWVIPPAPHPVEPVMIDVDLLAQHPVPVKGVVIEWENGIAPNQYEVWWAAADQQIHTHTVVLGATVPPPTGAGVLPVPTAFTPTPPYAVRYLRLRFSNSALMTQYKISGLHLLFDTGDGEEDKGGAFDDGLDVLVAAGEPLTLGEGLRLYPNRPNPFGAGTTIEFANPGPASAELRIFDVRGRLVRQFDDLAPRASRTLVTWDGRDSEGRAVASGVYFVELRVGTQSVRRNVVRLK